MDGHDYEYLVAKYLRGRGYIGVKVTKGSGDFGVDIIAYKAGHKYAVQCKYYSNPVGLSAIQEAVAGTAFYGCDRAMAVTNSTFTKAAHELAAANGVILLERVQSAGAFTFSQLPGFIKAILWAAYLFIASAMVASALKVIKNQSFWKAAYNLAATVTVASFPLWIGPAIRGIKKLIQRISAKIREKKATSKTVRTAGQEQPMHCLVNAGALQEYLPVEVQDPDCTFAKALSELSVLTTTAIQRKCRCKNECAYAVLQNLQLYGLVHEVQQFTYMWTKKVILLNTEDRIRQMDAEGHNRYDDGY